MQLRKILQDCDCTKVCFGEDLFPNSIIRHLFSLLVAKYGTWQDFEHCFRGILLFFVQNYDNLHPRKVFKNEYGLIKFYCLHKRQYWFDASTSAYTLMLQQTTVKIWCWCLLYFSSDFKLKYRSGTSRLPLLLGHINYMIFLNLLTAYKNQLCISIAGNIHRMFIYQNPKKNNSI